MIKHEIKKVLLDRIVVNPFQPRQNFCSEGLDELASSIKTIGIIHPPLVRPREDGETYEIIAGERRCRAARLAGLTEIAVVVRTAPQALSAEAALVENIQRADLNPIEIAKAMQNLIDEFGFRQEELCVRIGKKRSTVANYLRLLTLPSTIQESVLSGAITMGHAKAILALQDDARKNTLHDLIVKKDMSVREAEKWASKLEQKPSCKNHNLYLDQLAEKLQQTLGTKVVIHGNENRGAIAIDYFSLDDLNRLLESLGVNFD